MQIKNSRLNCLAVLVSGTELLQLVTRPALIFCKLLVKYNPSVLQVQKLIYATSFHQIQIGESYAGDSLQKLVQEKSTDLQVFCTSFLH